MSADEVPPGARKFLGDRARSTEQPISLGRSLLAEPKDAAELLVKWFGVDGALSYLILTADEVEAMRGAS